MHDPLYHLFETMKRVGPDADFKARARATLLAAGANVPRTTKSFRRGFFEDIAFGMALVCASVVLVLVGVIYSYVGTNALAQRALDEKGVLRESQAIGFDIELGEASYFTESADTVAAVLDEISETEESASRKRFE